MNDLISPRRRNQSPSRRGAFSLLEVAFALVIFVIGAIALLRIFPGGLSVLEDSGNRRVAAQMSQNVVTSYTSGDLASTTPEAIYEGDASGGWIDYPSSALGLRRQQGTTPLNTDDLKSAKDALRYIRGERQGVTIVPEGTGTAAAVSTNYPLDTSGRANVYREGIVDGVTVNTAGVPDFRNAVYATANRSDFDNSTNKVPFREPILKVDSVVANPLSPMNFGAYSPRVGLNCGATATTYTLTLVRDYTSTYPAADVNYAPPSLAAAANTTPEWFNGPTAPTGFAATITPTANSITVTVTVTASATPRAPASFKVNFVNREGLSLNCQYLVVEINDTRGVSAVSPLQPNAPLLLVKSPKPLRTNTTYYISTNAVQDQPLAIALADATIPVVPGYTAATVLSQRVRFRQYLGQFQPELDRTQIVLRPPFDPTNPALNSIPDVDAYIARVQYTNFGLDYNARDWEYVSEDIAQFGTPYPGDTANFVEPTTPEGQAQQQFLVSAGYSATTKLPRSDLREIRTRLGNLRGPIQVKAFYGQSNSVVTSLFNPRAAAQGVGTLTTAQQRAYTRQVNILMKEGRLYLPAALPAASGGLVLSHARVYYRSRDAWAQQVGVTPPHYIPYATTGLREPWREYFHNAGATGDKYIYFHAADAGKTVEVLHGATFDTATLDKMEIRPQITVNTIPAGVPTGFTTAYNDPLTNNPDDPREGKTYIARSQDRVNDTIFDIRRPTGTSGVSARTLWLNNNRYAQEIAQ